MDPYLKTRVEVQTLHELLPELDYYRILRIPRDAPAGEIDAAFQRESRWLHPDRYGRIGDAELTARVNDIYRFLSEARRTLKDPDARVRYDASKSFRADSGTLADAAQDAAAKQNPEFAARTPKGEKYWKMALKCWEDKDFKGAFIQIGFALSFEPDNETFKEWHLKAKSAMVDSSKDREHTYKLRIV
jgi:curved DNA-binding protein CbpA